MEFKVGDRIRILSDNAHGTNEKAGAILIINKIATSVFYCKANDSVYRNWGFSMIHKNDQYEKVDLDIFKELCD